MMAQFTETPWGAADQVSPIGDGIAYISTPSHGGVYVPPELNEQIPAEWREASWRGLAKAGWYEEDCDAAMVILTFPHSFARGEVENAYWFAARCDFAWPSRVSHDSLMAAFNRCRRVYSFEDPPARANRVIVTSSAS
jgi:hypothetical protein